METEGGRKGRVFITYIRKCHAIPYLTDIPVKHDGIAHTLTVMMTRKLKKLQHDVPE